MQGCAERRHTHSHKALHYIHTHMYIHTLTGRRAEDIQYTLYLVRRGMDEHHGCVELMCFHLLLLRYVGKDAQNANLAEKAMLSMQGLPIDCSFLLYAVQRYEMKQDHRRMCYDVSCHSERDHNVLFSFWIYNGNVMLVCSEATGFF
jgi:hypothetical protein